MRDRQSRRVTVDLPMATEAQLSRLASHMRNARGGRITKARVIAAAVDHLARAEAAQPNLFPADEEGDSRSDSKRGPTATSGRDVIRTQPPA